MSSYKYYGIHYSFYGDSCFPYASIALLYFDYTLTFIMEVECIWKRKFTGASLVYLVFRYASLISPLASLIFFWFSPSSPEYYQGHEAVTVLQMVALSWLDDICSIMTLVTFTIMTVLRIYGISLRDWRLLVIAIPTSLVSPGVMLLQTALIRTQQYPTSMGIAEYTITGVNMLLIFLTWYKTISIKRHAFRTGLAMPLTTLLIKDGTIFFIFIATDIIVEFPIGSAVASESLARDLCLAWLDFSPTFKVILFTRFMLNLRSIHFSDGDDIPSRWSDSRMSIVFRALPRITSSRVVGNLGSTIRTGDEDRDGWEEEEEENVGTSTGMRSGEDGADIHTRSRAAVCYSDDPFRAGMLDE